MSTFKLTMLNAVLLCVVIFVSELLHTVTSNLFQNTLVFWIILVILFGMSNYMLNSRFINQTKKQ
jgi:hypothetical protein